MKTYYLHQQREKLIVYFAGWGTPPSAVTHLDLADQYDLLVCYDYQDLQLDFDFSAYTEIYLVAWSMGVWVAEQVMQTIPVTKAIAINGTHYPSDDRFGIPTQIFQGTLQGLNSANRDKFERRMCQNRELLNHYQTLPDYRELNDIYQELAFLSEQISVRSEATLKWDIAWIGTQDRIFPTSHQQAYWQDRCQIRTIEAGHYIFPLFQQWETLWR
ncbi:DUF452 family protein [Gallibacterium melopsittaci]|uniref:DUF452 family protein n=1 Tax=Gallibacterium melopsittaci TaxID=516063 RepID=A0ABV6HWQ4_9PAST